MTRPVSEVRMDDVATCRYVLFIEGEPDAYTDDESGGLIGTGLGSWIGLSETDNGGREILGTRRVRGGLIVPETVSFEIEPKTGELAPSPATFEILDVDDTLSYLFASEGKDSEQLDEWIRPGTTDLGTSVATPGGGTTNPRGRYIGPERIGPEGERRTCPALPFDLVGFDHAVGEHLPAVLISDEPIDFAGRMVTLYRIYKVAPELDDSDPTAWALWRDAHEAGDLVWWGVLRDAGNVGGNNVWAIDCHGPDALTRRTLGAVNSWPSTWKTITVEPATSDDEKLWAVGFMSKPSTAATDPVDKFYASMVFGPAVPFTSTTRSALAAELDARIQSTLDGSLTNVAFGSGSFEDWNDGDADMNPTAGVTNLGRFWISRNPAITDESEWGGMFVCMHRDYWQLLGWEPWTQQRNETTFPAPGGSGSLADFRLCQAGEMLKMHGWITGMNVPASDYWVAMFNTVSPDESLNALTPEHFANAGQGGGPREWWPRHNAGTFTLRPDSQQVVRIIG